MTDRGLGPSAWQEMEGERGSPRVASDVVGTYQHGPGPRILDIYAGPGGWSEGLAALGYRDIGLEWDATTCATRAAAGHRTIRCDVRAFPIDHLGEIDGLIGSPPCQAFSAAGRKHGRQLLPMFTDMAALGHWHYPVAGVGDVLEVGRWVETLRPRWALFEQVPALLPVWQAYAKRWRYRFGWSAWAQVLNCADYGVPQTRKRAFLAVRTDGLAAHPPVATHCKGGSLTLEGQLFPWVSMADALGWGELLRPSTTLVTPGRGGGHTPIDGGSNSRRARAKRVEAGEFLPRDQARVGFPRRSDGREGDDEFRERDWRDVDEPAFAVTEKARSWVLNTGRDWKPNGTREDAQTIPLDQPAPALLRKSGNIWQLRLAQRGYDDVVRDIDEPAPTLAFGRDSGSWVFDLPATTLSGDPRITARCHHPTDGSQGKDAVDVDEVAAGRYDGTKPIKLTIDDALALQTFRPGYPVQGKRTRAFGQIGDAVPPLMAEVLLREMLT